MWGTRKSRLENECFFHYGRSEITFSSSLGFPTFLLSAIFFIVRDEILLPPYGRASGRFHWGMLAAERKERPPCFDLGGRHAPPFGTSL